jgi:hypothetical protein
MLAALYCGVVSAQDAPPAPWWVLFSVSSRRSAEPDFPFEKPAERTGPGYTSRTRQIEFYERVLKRLRELPGVVSAAVTTSIPLNGDGLPNSAVFRIEGRPPARQGREPQTSLIAVSPDFFDTLSIPLLEGRFLSNRDRPALRCDCSGRGFPKPVLSARGPDRPPDEYRSNG